MKSLLATALAVLGSVAPAPAVAGAAHDPGPMRTVHALIDGWRTANFEQASKTFAPQFRLLTLRRSETGPDVQIDERDHLLGSMRTLSAGVWDVRLGKAIELQDGSGVATVWAPYTFYLNGRKATAGSRPIPSTAWRKDGGSSRSRTSICGMGQRLNVPTAQL